MGLIKEPVKYNTNKTKLITKNTIAPEMECEINLSAQRSQQYSREATEKH